MALPFPNAQSAKRYLEYVEKAVLAGHPDMLYLDQLGAVPAHLDFAPQRHRHRHYGEWTAGSTGFLRVVTQYLRPRRPDLVFYIECPNPAQQQYANLSMYGTTQVLRYVFPTYYGIFGSYGDIEPERAHRYAGQALLTGEPPYAQEREALGGSAMRSSRTSVRSYCSKSRLTRCCIKLATATTWA